MFFHFHQREKLKSDLQAITNFRVDRCFKTKEFGTPVTAQLHHYADASQQAYVTASDLLLHNATGEAQSALMMEKA